MEPISFDPIQPFPEQFGSYQQEKDYSAHVDAWLGLKVEETEKKIIPPKDGAERWHKFGPGTFLTPYPELRRLVEWIPARPGARWVDLGAAYGRLGFVLHRHRPEARFLGFELVPERVQEGNRVLALQGCLNAGLEVADLESPGFFPPTAEIYFIYDFGTRRAVRKILLDLQIIARERPIAVIGRGREVRDQAERDHPWLSGVVAPEHRGNISLYRSASCD